MLHIDRPEDEPGIAEQTLAGHHTEIAAARLCEVAKDGQILVTSRIAAAVAEGAEIRELGPLTFKGLSRPLAVCNFEALKVTGHSTG